MLKSEVASIGRNGREGRKSDIGQQVLLGPAVVGSFHLQNAATAGQEGNIDNFLAVGSPHRLSALAVESQSRLRAPRQIKDPDVAARPARLPEGDCDLAAIRGNSRRGIRGHFAEVSQSLGLTA